MPAKPLSGVHVLLVEDCSMLQRYYRSVLERYGASVTATGSADEALTLVEVRKPDIVLSDICMPKRSGIDLIEALRRHRSAAVSQIGAIAMTASEAETEGRSLKAGFDKFLQKPVDPHCLVAAVQCLV